MVYSSTMRCIARLCVPLFVIVFPICAAAASASPSASAAPSAQPLSDPLGLKAVELARAAKPWVPGVTVMRIEVTDDKGKLLDSYDSRFRITPDAGGAPVMSVESSTHNGKDETKKEREAQEKRNRDAAKDGKPAFDMGDNPFDPDVQALVTGRAQEGTREIEGRTCVVYSFSLKRKDGSSAVGTAALERDTGAPVEVSYTLSPLPRGAQSFTAVLRYGRGPAGQGFLLGVEMDGEGRILFISRAFHSDIVLDGWWKRGP